ncbi:sulfotransferase [Pseudodesulfovibrio indicus]|uniref:sulfotransferase family protein n=1 Tax=Pseudodesulfovibrio indicus TaxID=1716143 RepID=UPI00292E26DD|nr:sulfotransferase [Pseudodesulfovibrio indicus]
MLNTELNRTGETRRFAGGTNQNLLQQVSIQSSPIFVVGCPRSGTSVLSLSMGLHPDLWVSAESNFLVNVVNDAKAAHAQCTTRGPRHWLSKESVGLEEYLQAHGLGINALYMSRSGGKRWVDQTPEYMLIARELAVTFPQARFLHLVRDGRDVVNSMINSGFPVEWANSFTKACQAWNRFTDAGVEFEGFVPERILRLHHEEIKADPESQFKRICAFLELDYDESMIQYYAKKKVVNSSFKQKGTTKSSWRKSWTQGQYDYFSKACSGNMQSFDYEVEDVPLPAGGPGDNARTEPGLPQVRFGEGFYPDEGGMVWSRRKAVFTLTKPPEAERAAFAFRVSCSLGAYYDAFPFVSTLRLDGEVIGRIPFQQDNHSMPLLLDLNGDDSEVEIEIETPAGFVPSKVSDTPDDRELSLLFSLEAVELVQDGEKRTVTGSGVAVSARS